MIECVFAFGILMLPKQPLPHQYLGVYGAVGYIAYVHELKNQESNWIELVDRFGRSMIYEADCNSVK